MPAKPEIVTFKADPTLVSAMKGIRNRSDFIRGAVLAALEGACPLCKGTGILTLNQRRHWSTFARNHSLRECRECFEVHLVCSKSPAGRSHDH